MHTYGNSVLKSSAQTIDHCVSTVPGRAPTTHVQAIQWYTIYSTVVQYNSSTVIQWQGNLGIQR